MSDMKSMRKLTIKNLLLNKTRTIVTMIGVLLSAALITLVSCMALSIQQTAVNFYAQRTGDFTAVLYGNFSDSDFIHYQSKDGVQKAVGVSDIGVVQNPYAKYGSVPYISIIGVSEGGLEDCFNATLSAGRYPENTDEIVLSKKFVKSTTKTYNIGDTITLDIGQLSYFHDGTGETIIIPSSDPYYFDGVAFSVLMQKTYTVVGILDNVSNGIDSANSSTVYLYTVTDKADSLNSIFMKFTPSGEQNYIQTLGNVLDAGADTGLLYGYTHDGMVDISNVLEKNHIDYFGINKGILRAKLIEMSLEDGFMVTASLIVIFGIIIISSIFIIRNSFYISISEKAKLYGMLSSIGATPKQIRNNVFFEGFLIGVLSIPLGILIGIAGTAGLVDLCNSTLADVLGGIRIQFAVSWIPLVMALILCAGTIFMSVLSPAIETSRITPIEAIRGSREVKISGRKRKKAKVYKTPKLISKWFGVGGNIAWKNLKRSKSKYRATVISITVSVAIYLAISTVIGSLVDYVNDSYESMPYNMSVFVDYDFTDKESTVKTLEKFHQIADRDEINLAVMDMTESKYWIIQDFPQEKYADATDNPNREAVIHLTVVDDNTYKSIAKMAGYETQKDKYILVDCQKSNEQKYDDKGNFTGYDTKYVSAFKNMENYTFKMMDYDAYYYEERMADPDFEEYGKMLYADGYMEKYGTPIEMTAGACITAENSDFIKTYSYLINIDSAPHIFVTEEWFIEHSTKLSSPYWFNKYFLYSSDDLTTEEALDEMGVQGTNIQNSAKEAAMLNAISFIMQFFVYSFIGILALIGLTNVFNTIHTNMNLRKKEFAALRSVGMTTREFDGMITLESIFYTFKALTIGVPIGLLLGWLGYTQIGQMSGGKVAYTFPIIPLLLSVGAVALLVWLIMTVSIRKIRNQNIIETIRSDNI